MNMRPLFTAIPLLFSCNLAMAQETPDPTTLQTQERIRLQQQAMTLQERALYQQMNAERLRRQNAAKEGADQSRGGTGKGDKKRLRDGSGGGDALRIERSSEYTQPMDQRSRYGSGFGSRMGGAHGRR